MRGVMPISAVSQRRSISRVKCLASWGEWITSRVSSLVCAAEGDQLKLPVITVLLSITANLWCSLSPRLSLTGFSGILKCPKPEFKPLSLIGGDEMPQSYRELSELGFWLGAALSQIPVIELDLEESTNPEE